VLPLSHKANRSNQPLYGSLQEHRRTEFNAFDGWGGNSGRLGLLNVTKYLPRSRIKDNWLFYLGLLRPRSEIKDDPVIWACQGRDQCLFYPALQGEHPIFWAHKLPSSASFTPKCQAHRNIEGAVRSLVHKLRSARLVVGSVTTSESLVLYVLFCPFSIFLFFLPFLALRRNSGCVLYVRTTDDLLLNLLV